MNANLTPPEDRPPRASGSSSGSRPDGPGVHIVDDDEQLTCWWLDLLSSQEGGKITEHVASCSYCRRALADLVRNRVLDFSHVKAAPSEMEIPPSHGIGVPDPPHAVTAPSVAKWRTAALWRFVLAGCILVGIVGIWWYLHTTNPRVMLAQARRDLEAGNVATALQQAEELLGKKLDSPTREEAERVLARAGYTLARSQLIAERFEEVLEIEHSVSSRIGVSSRLLNLKLQAERGVPAEYVLAYAGSLTDYGYELDGSSPQMALPTIDQTTERLSQELQQAVAEHSNSVDLRLNYGQFLLYLRRFEEARGQFTAALVLDRRNPLARLGLGLLEFELREYKNALEHFEAVVKIDPDSLAGHLNAAICLEKLGRPADARQHWRRAGRLANSTDLQQRIEARISGSGPHDQEPP